MQSVVSRSQTIFVVAGQAASLVNFRLPLLQRFRAMGYEVHACAPGLLGDQETACILKQNGILLHDVPFKRAGINPASDLLAVQVLYKALRAARPDIVLCYTVKPVIWGTLAAAAARVPRRIALITGLGYAFTGKARGKRYLVRRVLFGLYRKALQRADHVFFQNPDDAAEFRSLRLLAPDASVSVVNGSGVDLEHFAPAPLPPLSGGPRFLLVARMLGDKGIREFATAAARIKATHPHVEFNLVGGTDANPDSIPPRTLKAWVAEKSVIWHGAQADVRPCLGACHVYVLPSYREGTPRSVLEAMATGRAIITTDAPGCRETVVPGVNGFLVPPRDAKALEQAMRRFLEEPDLIQEMGRESLRIARGRYDVMQVNEQMLQDMGLIE
ncbi:MULTISPECIES: glycosyltransferase family 4 protein [unclassified Sulfitobacter]|uniref:glycosyltransferase family 4 protein n=1 Tax=unclassified Sulfitobacter TaxID=196795 RepID=UPI0023E0D263|nr:MULTISPECIES: glycosyltransferase family 4 protein [unclassified Sulfitobacter]MDF3384585.1 glycosyltransferase family 4 protein [Sulfitobacter sp. Ks11]MDF3388074.1 glycosyltransferase family 4 protein [Sulfitobacter sp. M85]MDF3391494.1 glycosyltransferase family 4 protein [Sulfitobacter sp. Ks16]MDF3402061.1 glycosyltransferase family 4 protein [Sulfitobacter sp. KE39]MDF3405553.1 glycosyltransferase family 4 protein [Sulfitobacter sp. Ks35]